MEKKLIFVSMLIVFSLILGACQKPYVQVNNENYDYSKIVPGSISVSGSAVVYANGTSEFKYKVTPVRGGSTYTWEMIDATGDITYSDESQYNAFIRFDQPVADIFDAKLVIQETTMGGLVGERDTFVLDIYKLCSLTSGLNDLVGSWTGDDFGYTPIVTTSVDGEDFLVYGLSIPFIEDWWAETVVAGGTFVMDVNMDNGSVNIPRQYIYTTLYDGANYDYEIKGSGTWSNCGTSPSLSLEFDIYYVGAANGLAKTYAAYLPTPYMTAELDLAPPK